MKNAQIQKINKTCLALIMNQLKRIINYQNAQGQSNKANSHYQKTKILMKSTSVIIRINVFLNINKI